MHAAPWQEAFITEEGMLAREADHPQRGGHRARFERRAAATVRRHRRSPSRRASLGIMYLLRRKACSQIMDSDAPECSHKQSTLVAYHRRGCRFQERFRAHGGASGHQESTSDTAQLDAPLE